MQFEDPIGMLTSKQIEDAPAPAKNGEEKAAVETKPVVTPEPDRFAQLNNDWDQRMRKFQSESAKNVFHETKRQLQPVYAAMQEQNDRIERLLSRLSGGEPEGERRAPDDQEIEKRINAAAEKQARRILTEEMGLRPEVVKTANYHSEKTRFFSENPAAADEKDGYGMIFNPVLQKMEEHYQVDGRMLTAINDAVLNALGNLNRMYQAQQKELGSKSTQPQTGSIPGRNATPRSGPSSDEQDRLRERDSQSSMLRAGQSPLGRTKPKARNATDIVNFLVNGAPNPDDE